MLSDEYIQELVHETYAAHAVMMSAKLDPAFIFVGVQPIIIDRNHVTKPQVFVSYRTGATEATILDPAARPKTFTITIGSVEDDAGKKQFQDAWLEFSNEQPHMSRETLDAIVERTELRKHFAHVLMGLYQKGCLLSLPGEQRRGAPPRDAAQNRHARRAQRAIRRR